MSNDIKIFWDEDYLEGNFAFDEDIQDLESDRGLETAVIISLFTDRRANEDDVLPDSNNLDRRGWWGDLTSDFENDQIGSRLWLLEREKTVPNVVIRAKQYAEEALRWLIDDGVAMKVEVETERQGVSGNDILAISGRIFKPGGDIYKFKYETQWAAQELR